MAVVQHQGVVGLAQGADGAGAVYAVTLLHVGQYFVVVGRLPLGEEFVVAPAGADVGAGGDEDFQLEACVVEEGNVLPMTPPGGSVNQMLLEC